MEINKLIAQVKNCTICENYLQPNPIVSISKHSKILIIGQAPGQTVHKTGIPWNDKSGDNLRAWLGVDKTIFYDNKIFGLMPMGFCYPGTGKNGDLPPRTECAPYWHSQFLAQTKSIQLTLLIGQYAQNYYLKNFGDRLPEHLWSSTQIQVCWVLQSLFLYNLTDRTDSHHSEQKNS